ncbi:ATP-binding cassette domain-containing protein [Rathayibacter sp. VKM Ac-2927]|uniref:ATP-binding cassette domain-containing protein n=1 Tax=Rathayibacter sp. VKM Ac-2927 TaxID=2929478 RepID=UPI001FB1AEAC|nr:ABC transporter ATP-binding protein [Rathayibacter sp. VKM Ac-2927]MCJ1685523.1 ABC transporter ATP-binding protein [Rathayibacter sp. VKM Ac-2927]
MSIEYRGAGFRFPDGRGVADVSFAVSSGEIVCLLGPNGSGKSTALRLLLGLVRGDGEVFVDGEAAHRQPLGERLGSIVDGGGPDRGLRVRQYLELLRVARRASRASVEDALAEHGLNDLSARRIGALSLGQTQRVAFAGALLGCPANLVLDEPFNGVDAHAVPVMLDRTRRFADAGGSVILTSHHLAHLQRLVDRVVVLQEGRLIADSPIGDLLTSSAMSHVLVECDEPATLAEELSGSGSDEITITSTTELVVRGTTRRVIGEAASRRRLVVTRLEEITPTLEEVYLDLTSLRVEQECSVAAKLSGGG